MADSLTSIDLFVRGLATGAMAVLGLAIWRGGVNRSIQVSGVLMCASVMAWLMCESVGMRAAMGDPLPLVIASFPVGGLFWLFVMAVFEDRSVSPLAAAPPLVLLGLGFLILSPDDAMGDVAWLIYNAVSGALAVHAAFVIARGWSGDLMEGRRRLRGPALGFGAIYALVSVTMGLAARFDPGGPWLEFTAGRLYGGAIFAVLVLAASTVFLQVDTGVFGAPRRGVQPVDSRSEAAERMMLGKLNDFMAKGGWRQEGLTIGAVALALEAPEHRVRRLINQRLGYRNFAEFVNGHRIEAAKKRLADPVEARLTVAAIAFDLGYGSLGPFNRAFRAATGMTPTEFRRDALADSSPIPNEAL